MCRDGLQGFENHTGGRKVGSCYPVLKIGLFIAGREHGPGASTKKKTRKRKPGSRRRCHIDQNQVVGTIDPQLAESEQIRAENPCLSTGDRQRCVGVIIRGRRLNVERWYLEEDFPR